MSDQQFKFEMAFGIDVDKAAKDELIAALQNAGAKVTPKEEQAVDPESVFIVLKIIAAGFSATKAGLELSEAIRNWRKRQRAEGSQTDIKLKSESKDAEIDLKDNDDKDIDEWFQA